MLGSSQAWQPQTSTHQPGQVNNEPLLPALGASLPVIDAEAIALPSSVSDVVSFGVLSLRHSSPALWPYIYIYISGFSASFWYHVMDAAFLTRKKWHIAGTPPASSSPFSCQEDGFTPRSRNMRRQFWTLFHQLSWSTDASKWSTDGSCFSDLTASPGHG